VLSGTFLAFIALLFGMANILFKAAKKEELKEWTKMALIVISILMCGFMFLLEIPFVTSLLQGYQCEEDPDEEYSLPDISCGS
jgi:uncharacterized membrane protein